MTSPHLTARVTCAGCGMQVRYTGLAAHKKTLGCVAETARKDYAQRGWSQMGYERFRKEATALGVPIERARTARRNGKFVLESWWPDWVRPILNNWPPDWVRPILNNWPSGHNPDLLRAFTKKLVQDRTTAQAWTVLWDAWHDEDAADVPDLGWRIVKFALAAVGAVEADAEVASAVEALRKALLRRSYE